MVVMIMAIYNSVEQLIGKTPMLKLNKIKEKQQANMDITFMIKGMKDRKLDHKQH